jgi:branched-chain amino acid transport system ATP-binding protein
MWFRESPFVLGGSGRAHLKVDGLSAGYGPFLVLRDLTLEAKPGLTVILGPNGAGKTTLLKALAGLIPRRGWIALDGEDLPEKTHEVVRAGIALVAEGRQLFPQMTVAENLELGGWLVPKAERARRLEHAFADFPKLRERARQLAGTMSGGEQQMVAVARAMMSVPRLLLLDEPSLGLAPRMVDELLAIARRIADAGTTVLMVEQNVKKALAVADRGYVIERGTLVASGPAKLLARSTVVREAYLGAQVRHRYRRPHPAPFPRLLPSPAERERAGVEGGSAVAETPDPHPNPLPRTGQGVQPGAHHVRPLDADQRTEGHRREGRDLRTSQPARRHRRDARAGLLAGRCRDGGRSRGRSLQDLERDRPRRTPRAAAQGG